MWDNTSVVNMSRTKTSERESGRFGRLFRWTVLLALVFSAGLITGQRLLAQGDNDAPFLALSSTKAVTNDVKPVKMTFSFYEDLSGKPDQKALPKIAAAKPNPPAEELAPVVEEKVEEPAVVNVPQELVETVQNVLEKPNAGEGALYTIQVASHPSRAMATRELTRLRAMGLDAHMIAVESNDGRFYRVRLGKFANVESVNGYLAQVTSDGRVQGFVTPF
jgi:cell division septation protein DedD